MENLISTHRVVRRTANGEKVPPVNIEATIIDNPLFAQAMVIGEGKAYLTALVVLDPNLWQKTATSLGVDADDKAVRKNQRVQQFMLDKIA